MSLEASPARPFAKRPDAVSFLVVGSHVVLVLAPVYLGAALDPSALHVLFWCWFGFLQQGLLNLMHECAHLHVFRRRKGSELLAHWLLGPLMVVSFERYREVHWAHHRELGGKGDPKYSYRLDIRGVRFLGFVLRSLLLVEAARKLLYVHGGATSDDATASVKPAKAKEPPWLWLARTCVFHTLFVASLCFTAWGTKERTSFEVARQVVLAYGFVYLYGILSLTVFAANLRAIAEHQLRANGDDESGGAALRNLHSNLLTHLVFGAYGFSEHATHHWNPAVPYYHLVEETKKWIGQKSHALPRCGYARALYEAVLLPSASASVTPFEADGDRRETPL